MKIVSNHTVTTYYVEDGMVPYKVVRSSWTPEPAWRDGRGDDWKVFASQGIHRYQRLCDPDKGTHKRVLAALQAALAAPPTHTQLTDADRATACTFDNFMRIAERVL